MKINKNAHRSQHTLRRRPNTSPNSLHGVRIVLFYLILLVSVAAVFLCACLGGFYIRDAFISRNLWKSYTWQELQAHFDCEEAFKNERSWWTPEQWTEVRDLYRDFAKKNKAGTYQMAKDITFDFSEIAEPFQAGEKGRGLRAARDILEGEVVQRMTNNTIVFTDGLAYRKFLFALEERFPTFACDIMIWSWMEDLDADKTKSGIVTDLDDNNLMNEPDEDEDVNVMCGSHGEEDSCDYLYASRTIRKGEELVTDYNGFEASYWWNEMVF